MTEHLRYGLRENGLVITAPSALVHYATAGHGPLLDEVRRPLSKRTLVQEYSPDGHDVDLLFDVEKYGRSATLDRVDLQTQAALEMILQLESVAHETGIKQQDPRLDILHHGVQGVYREHLDRFAVSFERPDDSDPVLSRISQAAVMRYGLLTGLYQSVEQAEANARSSFDTDTGLHLEVDAAKRRYHPALITPPAGYSPASRRVEAESLASPMPSVPTARLVSLMGVIAMLPGESLFRAGHLKPNASMDIPSNEPELKEVRGSEMRRLVGGLQDLAALKGSRDVDFVPDMFMWTRPGNRYRVVLSNQEGVNTVTGPNTEANLSLSIYDDSEKETTKTSLGFNFKDRRALGLISWGDRLTVELARTVRVQKTGRVLPSEELDIKDGTVEGYAQLLRALIHEIETRSQTGHFYDQQSPKKIMKYVGDHVEYGDETAIELAIERLLRHIDS